MTFSFGWITSSLTPQYFQNMERNILYGSDDDSDYDNNHNIAKENNMDVFSIKN